MSILRESARDPVLCKLLPGRTFALGDLIFRDAEIADPVRRREGQTFRRDTSSPSPSTQYASPDGLVRREHPSPAARPRQRVSTEQSLGRLPYRICRYRCSLPPSRFPETDLRQLAVFRKSRDAVIDRAVGFIGVAVGKQRRYDIDHLRNVMRRPRNDLGSFIAKSIKIFEEILLCERFGEFVDRNISGGPPH